MQVDLEKFELFGHYVAMSCIWF